MGADYMVEYWSGDNTNLHEWDEDLVDWVFVDTISNDLDSTGRSRELCISRSDIGETTTTGEKTDLIFQVGEWNNGDYEDYEPNVLSTSLYTYEYIANSLIITAVDISKSVVEKSSTDNGMMMLDFYSVSSSSLDIDSITITRTGFDSVDSDVPSNGVIIYDDTGNVEGSFDSGDSEVVSGTFSSGEAPLSTSITIDSNSFERYFIALDIASNPAGKTIGLKIEIGDIVTDPSITITGLPIDPVYSWIESNPLIDNSDGKRLCIYYGYPSHVNSLSSNVAFAKTVFDDYDVIVFGSALEQDSRSLL